MSGVRAEVPDATGQREFGSFVDARRDALVRLAILITRRWEDGEDAVQDALASLYPRWAVLPTGVELDRYVNRAVVNACLKRLGQARSLPVADLEWLPDQNQSSDPAAAVVLARHAWQLCAELPPTRRAAVVLRFYQDLSFAEIAEILGCSEATARSHVHRAVAMLRARHPQEADDE